jgi:hypothetical protein
VGYRFLLGFAVGAHFAFLAYGVFGGFLSWRWPRTIWLHLVCVLWLVAIVAFAWRCPLTWLEDRSRAHLGRPPPVGGFLDNHVAGVFYPHGQEAAARLIVALIVLASWVGLIVRQARRRRSLAEARTRVRRPRRPAGSWSRSRRASPGRAAPR